MTTVAPSVVIVTTMTIKQLFSAASCGIGNTRVELTFYRCGSLASVTELAGFSTLV